MKRKDLKLGESYYVNSSRDHDAYARHKHVRERKVVHLGPFSKDNPYGFYRIVRDDVKVTLHDGRVITLPRGFHPTGSRGIATHVLAEVVEDGRIEPVLASSIRLPWDEFVALRDAAIEKEKRLTAERERAKERTQKIESLIREKHPDVTFTYWPGNKNVNITLLELAKLAGIEVEKL